MEQEAVLQVEGETQEEQTKNCSLKIQFSLAYVGGGELQVVSR